MKRVLNRFRFFFKKVKSSPQQHLSALLKISVASLFVMSSKKKFAFTKNEENKFFEKLKNSKIKTTEIILEKELEIGKPVEIEIEFENTNKKEKFLLVKLEDNLIRVFNPYCPYDNKSDLKNALIIQDKLICSHHGCEFNINTGYVEQGPALDHMLIYPGYEKIENRDQQQSELNPAEGIEPDEKENDFEFNNKDDKEIKRKIIIKVPEQRPDSYSPFVVKKDPGDFRKVIIIGSGPAGISSAENLRKLGYKGQILLFTKELSSPVQKHNLTKFTTFENNRKMLFFRDYNYFQNLDIQIFYGNTIKNINNDFNHVSYVENSDGKKYLYDALILASGDNKNTLMYSEKLGDNVVILDNIFDFRKSASLLPKAKNVVISNISLESLELASTLKRDFPNLNIKILQSKKDSLLENCVGREMSNEMINYFKEKGIKFYFLSENCNMVSDPNKTEISHIEIPAKNFKNRKLPKKLKTDIVYIFNPNSGSSLDFVSHENKDAFHMGKNGRLQTNEKMRGYEENIFLAGSIASVEDQYTKRTQEHIHYVDTLNQAEIAAFNILGLNVSLIKPFFSYYNFFGETFQKTGFNSKCDYFNIGDIKKMNFLRLCVVEGVLVGAIGMGLENNRRLMLLREALKMRSRIYVDENELKNPDLFFQKIYDQVNSNPFGGCHMENIYKRRFAQVPNHLILFKDKAWYDEMNISRFVNNGYNL